MGYLCGFVVGVLSIYIWRAVAAVYIYILFIFVSNLGVGSPSF